MWNWINCYLSGRHDYGIWCEPGAVFLRCVHCGKRSSGWDVDARPLAITRPAPVVIAKTMAARVGPFQRSAS